MNEPALTPDDDELVRRVLERTPARLLAGRAGTCYRTTTALQLRADHAAARDAVHAELDLMQAFGKDRIAAFSLFGVQSQARSKAEYLMRPDLGRRLDEASRERIASHCPAGADLQVVIGDGLSATAVTTQAPPLLDRLWEGAKTRGWRFGRPFAVRFCRVAALNDVGDLLTPEVVVLLIGERPGLATAESLSAYLAFRPRAGHTDAHRNLISNIHPRGVPIDAAAVRILALAESLRAAGRSGVGLTEMGDSSLPQPGQLSRNG